MVSTIYYSLKTFSEVLTTVYTAHPKASDTFKYCYQLW